jgi:hypothetical protein
MKRYKYLILAAVLLAGTGVYADGFGFNIGPFNMQFGGSDNEYFTINRKGLDSPICQAISTQKRLEIMVEGTEIVNTKEKKMIVRTLIVEPYAFGVTKEGKPMLQGKVVEDRLVKEVTLKYGDEKFNEESVSLKENEKGYFSGLFSSNEIKGIDIRKISGIRVIEDSHFDIPKDHKSYNNENFQVSCQLPVVEK